MKEQIAWLSLEANKCNPYPPPLTRKPKPCSETVNNANGEEPMETTAHPKTQLTIRQDVGRPLYSGCEKETSLWAHLMQIGIIDSALCDCKNAEQTVHHILQYRSIWRQQRRQLWPQDELTTYKLRGTTEDLRRTTHFLSTCGLWVYARLIDRRIRRRWQVSIYC